MHKKRRGLIILIIVGIILLSINPKTKNYLKAKSESSEGSISLIKEVETTHSSQIIYEKLDNGLLQYWEGILIYYDMNGNQVWSVNLSINRPTIKTNTNSVYVIDENKNQIIRINKNGEVVYKNTLDKPYKNFSICEDNYVVLHHASDSPVQYLTIIDEKGSKIGEITLSEGMVTNLAISKANEKIALSTIGINGDSLENNVSIYDLKGNLLGVENLKNNIIINIFYNKKGDLIVVDEKNIFSIDENNKVKWETNFNETIDRISKNNMDYITIYSEGSNKNSIIYSTSGNKMKTLGYDGKFIGEIKTKEDILDIDNYKNDMIAHSLRTVFRYSKNGDVKMEYPYSSDILKSFGLSENNIAVITREKVAFLQHKKK